MKNTTHDIINPMKEYLEVCLNELYAGKENNDFVYGEKTAYIECLEFLQKVSGGNGKSFAYEIEKRYPLN